VLRCQLQLGQPAGLLQGDLRTSDEVGHASDGAQGRADLIAHVGQEGALCGIGGLGPALPDVQDEQGTRKAYGDFVLDAEA